MYYGHVGRPHSGKTLLRGWRGSQHILSISTVLGLEFDIQNILIEYFLKLIPQSHVSESFANLCRELTHWRNVYLGTVSKRNEASNHGPRSLHPGPQTNLLNIKC